MPGRVVGAASFLDGLGRLAELLDEGCLRSVTLQCNAESLAMEPGAPLYRRFRLNLLVCESPDCGVAPPMRIISNYLAAKPCFSAVSLIGPSPMHCVRGASAGTNIRRSPLCQRGLLFVMHDGDATGCPLGHLPVVGNLERERLAGIVERAPETDSRPVFATSGASPLPVNVCSACEHALPRRGGPCSSIAT